MSATFRQEDQLVFGSVAQLEKVWILVRETNPVSLQLYAGKQGYSPKPFTCQAKTAYFFLEADRSTMSNARFLAKLTADFHFWTTQVRSGQHPSGMKGFRVLTLTLSEERRDNLRRIAQEVDPKGRGLNMFWFVCERSYQARSQELRAPIWQTPQDDTLRGIFD